MPWGRNSVCGCTLWVKKGVPTLRIPALIFRTVSDSDGVSCFLPRHEPRSAARFRDATAGQSLLTSLDFCQTGRSWDEKAHKRPQGSVSNFPFQLEASRCSPIIESFSPNKEDQKSTSKLKILVCLQPPIILSFILSDCLPLFALP